jgi:hypothetical protein
MLRPTVSRPVYLGIKHPSGTYDQIFISVRQLRVCWCGALSLKRGRVCRLQVLLVLASAVIFGSDFLGILDHLLLSHSRDFPVRRLLRLAELRWKYSTPPPPAWDPRYIAPGRIHTKHRFLYCCEGVFTVPLHRHRSYSIATCVFIAAGMCLPCSCLAKDVSSDFTIPAFRHHVTNNNNYVYFSSIGYGRIEPKEFSRVGYYTNH